MTNSTVELPNGSDFWLAVDLTDSQATGVLVLVITSSISAFAVLSLFAVLAISAWNTRKVDNPNMFVRSHAAAFLVSLLLCDLLQAVGSIMNAKWYAQRAVTFQPFCEAQGAIKHVADVGIALWSFIIAVHTFLVLFLRAPVRKLVMLALLVAVWAAIGTLVIAGPAALDTKKNGPFFAISGYWCWISDQYPLSRITLDYMFMFASAFLSFVLYSLVFLKLRGNIVASGSRIRFRLRRGNDTVTGLAAGSQIVDIAKTMMIYPVAYTIMILPIAVCRFMDWNGQEIPFAATIFTDTVFLLSGTVNVALFFAVRRVLPRHSVITKKFGAQEPTDTQFSFIDQNGPTNLKKSLDRESAIGLTDEKNSMFQRVDSPDSYPREYDARSFTSYQASENPENPVYPVAYPKQPTYPAQVSNAVPRSVDHEEDDHGREEAQSEQLDDDHEYYNVVDAYGSATRPSSFVSSARKSGIRPLSLVQKHSADSTTGHFPFSTGRRSTDENISSGNRASTSSDHEYPVSAASQMRYPQSLLTTEAVATPTLRTAPVKSSFRDSIDSMDSLSPTSPVSR